MIEFNNVEKVVMIREDKLLDLLKNAFEEGWSGYKDLRDSVAENLIQKYIDEVGVSNAYLDNSKKSMVDYDQGVDPVTGTNPYLPQGQVSIEYNGEFSHRPVTVGTDSVGREGFVSSNDSTTVWRAPPPVAVENMAYVRTTQTFTSSNYQQNSSSEHRFNVIVDSNNSTNETF